MKKIILIAFLVFSCTTPNIPPIKNKVRRLYSIRFNTCYCQWYNLNKFYNVDNFKRCDDFYAENFPSLKLKPNLEYCDDLVGFSKETWAKKITPYAHYIISWANDNVK